MLSKYRNEIFGMAALGVIAVHGQSVAYAVPILQKVMGYGGAGVYLFSLLSGIGLYYSLTNQKRGGVVSFYKRRFTRVVIPYLVIAGIWYGIKYLIIDFYPINFLYELSTLSFWFEHRGAWYVAMLIPVYLCYPFYYKLIERKQRGLRTTVFCGCVFIFSV